MHVAFAVLCQGPVDVTVTAGNGSERAEWRRLVQPGGFYVVDRGYVDYSLFQELHDVPCSFICRVKDNAAYEVQEARAVARRCARVVDDAVLRRLGTAHHTLAATAVPCGAGRDRQDAEGWHARRVGPGHQSAGPGRGVDCRGVSVSVGGRTVFPLGQMCLGRRHLLSQGINGVRIQVYAAFIASLLISLWVGRAPTKRTYEML